METNNSEKYGHDDSAQVNENSFDEYMDFYKRLRTKTKKWLNSKNGRNNKWADYLMSAPDLFHLLIKLLFDKGVPSSEKAKLVAVIAYFISPVDLFPEGLFGVIGYLDDIALTALVLNGLINRTDEKIVKKHWAGDEDILEVIEQIIEVADTMLGSGMWKKIREMNMKGF